MAANADFGVAQPFVADLAAAIDAALGAELVGLYLFGSLVLGDFDPYTSDIDLLAVVRSPLGDERVERLAGVHDGFVERHPEWADRVEVLYLPLAVLRAFPGEPGEAVRISPGEPLHRTTTSPHWLIDLYLVRKRGVGLAGPPPPDVLPAISRAQFVDCVRANVAEWREWVAESTSRRFHGYVVLTLCRAMHAVELGEQASKRRAAAWARERHPTWAALIDAAERWRRAPSGASGAAERADVLAFVEFVNGACTSP